MDSFGRCLAAVVGGSAFLGFSLACLPAQTSIEGTVVHQRALPELAVRFSDPPAESRIIKIIHTWPDRAESQDGLIQRLQKQGFGGVVCNVSFDQYLQSDTKWEVFERAVKTAKHAGMALWLYDERGYPSGNAGGLVLREHPEWEARGLLVADSECGPGPVELLVPPGQIYLATAFPVRDGEIDLEKKVALKDRVREGRLRWSAPAGRWHVMVVTEHLLYEGTHADGNLFEKMPYVNLLLPEPTDRFIDLTHQRYAERLGQDLGQCFVATFTDEPSLMSCYLKPMPWRPLPWATNLPVEFERRRGYALDESVLPALVGNTGSRGARIRYDFWLTVGELVSANYFRQIQERCREWRIPSGGHLLAEENIVSHVPLYGDFFRCARRLDAPSMDCLTSLPAEVPWYAARLLASAAELESRRIVMSETSDHSQVWRAAGDQRPKRLVTEGEIRGTCNRLIVSGVNAITSYYSFANLPDDALRRLNEWVGRCCTAVVGGSQVADVALLYPVETLWPRFRPARHWASDSPSATAVENSWRSAADSLFASQRDFTVVDSRALAEARVEAGALIHGQLQWRVLLLPETDTLPEATWDNLVRFVHSGGVVVALGALPANNESEFPSAKVQALARELFSSERSVPSLKAQENGGAGVFLPSGSEGMLPRVLDGLLDRDVTVHGSRSPVRATHRRIDGREIYFLVNDSPKWWAGEVTLSADGSGELWEPATAAATQTNLGRRVALNLEPYGAAILRYPKAQVPARRPAQTTALPNLKAHRLPCREPAMSAGEFVLGDVTSDVGHSQPGLPAWRASAKLIKSQVDTFLFVRFPFPEPLNLEAVDCLVLDVWVPDGQRTGTQLLAVLQEKGGGDFLATTGGLLGAPGHHRLYVPIQRFQLAGWSQDPDGDLDLTRVSEVRLGWGGYLGTEGEQVQFTLALPEIGSITRPESTPAGNRSH